MFLTLERRLDTGVDSGSLMVLAVVDREDEVEVGRCLVSHGNESKPRRGVEAEVGSRLRWQPGSRGGHVHLYRRAEFCGAPLDDHLFVSFNTTCLPPRLEQEYSRSVACPSVDGIRLGTRKVHHMMSEVSASPTFPRRDYSMSFGCDVPPFAPHDMLNEARWAARAASRAWLADEGRSVDATMFRLAVLDKVLEL